jgi:glycosyltransferase involved in cell wall biosynthesis
MSESALLAGSRESGSLSRACGLKIGIFAPMTGRRAGGPETYDMELVRGLARIDGTNQYTVYCVNDAAVGRLEVGRPNFRVHRLRPSVRFVSIPISLPLERLRRPVDLLHCTFVAPPFPMGRTLFSLLDLSPFSHPQFYPPLIRLRLTRLFSASIRKAEAVLCISEFTRNDLLNRFNYPPDRAFVTHLGVDPRYRPVTDLHAVYAKLQSYGIEEPYILCVGKLQARKNTTGLLRAFHLLKKQERVPHKLLFVGRKTWTSADVPPLVRELGLEKDILHTGHAPDDDLPYFYNGADALAYPSLFEGFGLPVVEAMACGTPVVTSNVTSLPEVAGDAAILVDPYNVEDIAGGLYRAVSGGAFVDEMRAKGLERARQFTWESTARKTLEAYQRFGAGGSSS